MGISLWRGKGMGYGKRRGGGPGFVQMPQIPSPPSGALRVAAPVDMNAGLDSPISPRTGRAPYIALVDILEDKIVNINVIANAAASAPRGAGMQLGQWLVTSCVKVVIASLLGPNLETILKQAGIRVGIIPAGIKLRDALVKLGIVVEL